MKLQEIKLSDKDEEASIINWNFFLAYIFGDTGTGKSVLAKIMASETSYDAETKKETRIIIVDPKGDYANRKGIEEIGIRQFSRENIWRNEKIACLTASIINYWKPRIKDMKEGMWMTLNFPQTAFSKFMEAITNYKHKHEDDPHKLYDFISKCPESTKEIKPGNDLIIPFVSKDAILSRFKPKMFTGRKKIHIPEGNLLFIPPNEWKENPVLMRIYYALMFMQMGDDIKKTSPLMIFDEASRLFPTEEAFGKNERENRPAIITWIDDVINVLMRANHIKIVVIAQRPSQLHYTMFAEPITYKMSFRISEDRNLRELAHDYERGIRAFLYENNKLNFHIITIPKRPGCEA